LKLLIFLSALLTGFTGTLSGDRRAEASEVGQSIAHALAIASEAVENAAVSFRPMMVAFTNAFASERAFVRTWHVRTPFPRAEVRSLTGKRLV
jgi:hypothetical protein